MKKLTRVTALIVLSMSAALAQKLSMSNLPPAVQKTVQAEAKGAAIRNIVKETEHGVVQYEVETMLNGRHRDFDVAADGRLLAVEEETSLDTIPEAAKASIVKKAGGGRLGQVELVTRGGETLYEASFTGKDGRTHEVLVKPDGTETRE